MSLFRLDKGCKRLSGFDIVVSPSRVLEIIGRTASYRDHAFPQNVRKECAASQFMGELSEIEKDQRSLLGHGSGSDKIVAWPTRLSKHNDLCEIVSTTETNLTSHKTSKRSLHYIISLSIF